MKKYFIFSLAFILFLTYSCSKEYDLSNVDKNICIGGEQFVFPLGNSTKMVPDSLLNFSTIKELQKDDLGNYFFNYSGTVSQEISFLSLASKMCLPNQEKSKTISGSALPVLTDAELDLITFPFVSTFSGLDVFSFAYDLSAAGNEGLKRLDSTLVQTSNISADGLFGCESVTSLPEGMEIQIDLKVPSRIKTRDDRQTGDVIKLSSALNSAGKTAISPVSFNKVDLSGSTDFKYSEDVSVQAIRLSIPSKAAYKAVMGKNLSFDLSMSIQGADGGIMVPEVAWCLVERDTDPVHETIDITGIPDYMRDGILDLVAPLLGLDVTTNATVPVKVDAAMTSYSGSGVIGSASASLVTDYVQTPYQEVTSKYLLANEDMGFPGYEFVKTDLRSLVKKIPESISLDILPATWYDATAPSSQQVVFLKEATEVDLAYNFSLPLVFGSSLNMSIRDTVINMPERLGEILTKRDISLIGDAESTLPMDLTLKVNFLDKYGKSLDMYSSETVIKGTAASGTPVVTSYSVDVKKSTNAGKISMLEIILTLKNGQSVSLTKDDYVQLSLQASVPGGVEIEIDKD